MSRTPLALVLLAAASPFALGQELWRQNPFNTCGGYSSQDARNLGGLGWFSEVAEDFQAQADWRIGSIEFWGGYCTPDNARGNTQSFVIRFYTDNGNIPGTEIYEAEVTTFTEDLYYTIPGPDLAGYHYTLDLPLPFETGAAGEFWISIVAVLDRGGTSSEPQWGWAESFEDYGSIMASWFFDPHNFQPNLNNAEMAFVLHAADDTCAADLSGSSDPNDPSYGVPDGSADSADFFYYLDQFVAGNLAEADLTGSSDPNDPAYGVPDGLIDAADFFYYLDLFVQGC
ncbi:MAG: hypothetical protein IT439_05095 [Phycisphaerales bacterium]|nr:hypothetical protein [Phycisphaerales bacterium]